MRQPYSEYDYGTAAIMLMQVAASEPDFMKRAQRRLASAADRQRKLNRIERYHGARPDRVAYVKAMRWVATRYPQHFHLMPLLP